MAANPKYTNYARELVALSAQIVDLFATWELADEEWTALDLGSAITQEDLTGELAFFTPAMLANAITAFRALQPTFETQKVNFFTLTP